MTDFDLNLEGDEALAGEFRELKERGEGDRVDVVGTNVEYGIYLEMGTEDMPPYPWFRPAIREFRANPEDFILENTGWSSIDNIPSANHLIGAVSSALERQMKKNVSADRANDRSPGTHPDHPQIETGTLRAEIEAVRIK